MQSPSNPLIFLASASPRRSTLLTQIGIAHAVRPVAIDERLLPQEQPAAYVSRLAVCKAQTLWSLLEPARRLPVLGSDTTVAMDEQILGKPENEADCVRMLSLLSGRVHQVLTAIALCHSRGCETRLSISEVKFRELAREEMRAYWRTGEPADKAGGYAIQGMAGLFVERITGSYSGIVGLPLFETAALLGTLGWNGLRADDAASDVAPDAAMNAAVPARKTGAQQ